MSDNNKSPINFGGGGIGLGTLLTIVFLILKLCGVISWGWFFVFLPLIISASIGVIFLIIVIICAGIIASRSDRW